MYIRRSKNTIFSCGSYSNISTWFSPEPLAPLYHLKKRTWTKGV